MSALALYIGDKNLSSWSLRAWLLMKQADIPFTEKVIRLDRTDTREAILKHSPSGLVPCLVDGDIVIWDSLAIAEYLAESFPQKRLWPTERAARAMARSVSAEMHSGFSALRTAWPMKFSTLGLARGPDRAVQRDIDRIIEIWEGARAQFGAHGPFLFGAFSIADAMYAPVVSRLATYGPIDLPARASAYRDTIFALPAMKQWGAAAAREAAGG